MKTTPKLQRALQTKIGSRVLNPGPGIGHAADAPQAAINGAVPIPLA